MRGLFHETMAYKPAFYACSVFFRTSIVYSLVIVPFLGKHHIPQHYPGLLSMFWARWLLCWV